MSNPFKNRVFGCAVVKALNSNYNADFTHQPRTLPDGTVYATDKVLKYSVRNYLKKVYPNDSLLFFKNFTEDMQPRTLDDTYKVLFGDFPKKASKKADDKNEFVIFNFNGEETIGLLPEKPKPKQVKDYFKALDEGSELKSLSKDFDKVVSNNSVKINIEEAKNLAKVNESEEEGFFYYIEEDKSTKTKKLVKIEGEYAQIEVVAYEIDNLVTGGLDRKEILKNILSCIDVRLFGGTYAGATNLSIHGTVQVTHAINRFPKGKSIIYSEQIMSPFRNPNDKSKDSTMTTLGSQSKLNEGHYVHHFSVNPQNISEFVALCGGTPLGSDDIKKLKEGLTRGVTLYDSAAKAGTENELMLWVQLKEGSMLVLPSFVTLIEVKDDEKRTIDLSKVSAILKQDHVKAAIEKIELYYDKTTTTVVGAPDDASIHPINA